MSSLNSGLNQVFGSNYQGTQNVAQTGTSGTTSANTYNAGQQGLQNQLGTNYQNLINNGAPSSYTAPTATTNAYNQNFFNNLEPQLVAEYGAGSPQIGSQYSQGLVNLLGNTYQTGQGLYNTALNSAASYGTTPIGSTGNSTLSNLLNQNYSGSSGTGIAGSLLTTLLSLL